MCKTCFDMKSLRQCEVSCYCDSCMNNLYYCQDWLYQPPQPAKPDNNLMDSFINQLQNVSI